MTGKIDKSQWTDYGYKYITLRDVLDHHRFMQQYSGDWWNHPYPDDRFSYVSYQPKPPPLTIEFTNVDKSLAYAMIGLDPPKPAKRSEPAPREERGPEHCRHNLHRPCEECDPYIHFRWMTALSGGRYVPEV